MRRLKHGSARNSGALSAAAWRGPLLRWLGLLGLAALGLQLFFALRIGLIWAVDPQSTAFERSEAWQLAASGKSGWSQIWKPYGQISDPLKRAVITSEDDAFAIHDGVDWESIGKAWEKNSKAQAAVTKARTGKPLAGRMTKIVGGSTITQQLAKNLFLSGERNLLRKGQEFVLTFWLERLLDKERILEIYLNSVEWGEGVFGAEAAARHYFHKPAAQLSAYEAARLAVMLPRPKYFEKLPNSTYLQARAQTIVARMPNAELP
jgi:monofunctional biosynthetic peptidoglycan transglycosylase